MQQKGVVFEKLTQNEKRQLYFLTVCISKKFQFLSFFSNVYISLLMETDLRGKQEILHFNLISKDPKMNEGDKFSRNNYAKAKPCEISQVLPFISLTA